MNNGFADRRVKALRHRKMVRSGGFEPAIVRPFKGPALPISYDRVSINWTKLVKSAGLEPAIDFPFG